MIEFKNVCFKYEDKIIFENFSRKINKGEKIAITGASGAGKSTLINLLSGFLIAPKGEIFIDDLQISGSNISKIRQKISYLPQNFNVPFASVKELFMSPFELKINSKLKPSENQVFDIFSKLGLDKSIWNKKIDEISGGQKQRVLLASVFLLKKDYIFLDEPTSALDEKSTNMLIKTMFSYPETTIIAASHNKLFVNEADLVIKL